jgi:hypothetical protein
VAGEECAFDEAQLRCERSWETTGRVAAEFFIALSTKADKPLWYTLVGMEGQLKVRVGDGYHVGLAPVLCHIIPNSPDGLGQRSRL